MKLRFTPRAQADISLIHDFIAVQNQSAATALVARIRAIATLLAEYPGLGRETNVKNIRMIAVRRAPYVMYHRINKSDDALEILHIRHCARSDAREMK